MCRFNNAPFDPGKRSGGVEHVLSVLQIQDGVTFSRKTRVAAWQINENVATITEDFRWKSAVPPDCSGECVFGHETETLREDVDLVHHAVPPNCDFQGRAIDLNRPFSLLSIFR